jgi:hypothetical protein
VATKPHAAGAKCTGIAKPYVIKIVGYEFANMGRSACQFLDEDSRVQQSFLSLAVAAEANKIGESSESLVEQSEKGLCGWEDSCRML